jgi:uncharacterized integral membrane protein (TIGR00698 family)
LSGNQGISSLWKTEDWWAVWFGFIMIAFAIWGGAGKAPKLGVWVTDPADGFFSVKKSEVLEQWPEEVELTQTLKKNLKYDAEKKELSWKGVMSPYDRDRLLSLSDDPAYVAAVESLFQKPVERTDSILLKLFLLLVTLGFLTSIGVKFMGQDPWKYLAGFLIVFALSVVAFTFADHHVIKEYGLSYAFWALIVGLLISNTIGTPRWLLAGAKTEMFIKTGLVLLGAEVLFNKIVQLGGQGLIVAWIVTPTVIVFMYFFGTRVLKMARKTLVMIVACATSVCGVSAAIAAAAACKAKKEELTLAVGMTLIFTVLMMVFMPIFVKSIGMDPIVGGAWMGGTIDSTGAVVAAGAMLGAEPEKVAAVVKMIQNVLIGLMAFAIAVFWVTKVERSKDIKPSPMEIWYRLPKFVIGFVAASLVFSFILVPLMGLDFVEKDVIKAGTKTVRSWLFCMAFISIGLESNFKDLAKQLVGGKPIILYIVGQSFNLILTLLAAYLAFGGILFDRVGG